MEKCVPNFRRSKADETVQFTGPESVAAVAELVRKYRPRVSRLSAPALGTLRFYNSGNELHLKLQDWIVVRGGDVAVMPPALVEKPTLPAAE